MSNRFLLEEQLTIVSTKTLHEVFKEEFGADAIALYMFYYYTAKWQKTNQPKALSSYCKKGLAWGRDRFRRAKAILKKYDLVKDVQSKNKGGKITGWYIRINYLWGEKTIQTIKPQGGKTHRVVNQPTNALSVNKVKCLKRNKGKYSSLSLLSEKDFQEIAEKYNVGITFVRNSFDDLENYCGAHGRRYKNYKLALMNFVKKDAQKKGVKASVVQQAPPITDIEMTEEQKEKALKKMAEVRKTLAVKLSFDKSKK